MSGYGIFFWGAGGSGGWGLKNGKKRRERRNVRFLRGRTKKNDEEEWRDAWINRGSRGVNKNLVRNFDILRKFVGPSLRYGKCARPSHFLMAESSLGSSGSIKPGKRKKRTRNDRSFSTLPQELVPCVGSDRYLFIWLRLNESYRHLSCGTGNWPHALSCNCGRFTISTWILT